MRVTTHPRVMRQPWPAEQAWSFVDALLASRSLAMLAHTDRHAVVAAAMWREVLHLEGNLMHDAHTAALMREHGIRRIYTRDTDFHAFQVARAGGPDSWIIGRDRPLTRTASHT